MPYQKRKNLRLSINGDESIKQLAVDTEYCKVVLREAIQALYDCDTATFKLNIRKLIVARFGYDNMAKILDIHSSSLQMSLNAKSNPKLNRLMDIIKVIKREIGEV